MAAKDLDPQRARAARDVVRQHPGMALFVASPVLIAAGIAWWATGSLFWGVLLLIAAVGIGGWALVRKR